MTKTKAFTAQRWRILVEDTEYFIVKGNSKYSRFYVLDASGKYLSKGATNVDAAMADAVHIYNRSTHKEA